VQIVELVIQRQQHVPEVILVDKNHDAYEVVRNVQQQNIEAHNNIATSVENIMAHNGLNVGLHRPNFVSPLSEYVLQTELPSDTSESTVEHIASYLMEAGDIANNENLRLKFFPNSLTKNAFTWFTMLALHSIQHWNQLERLFHEQCYMDQSKISLKELASVRRQITESIHDYLNRVRLLCWSKMCLTINLCVLKITRY
jgi:UV DNA damage repair endonuclease